MPIPLARALRTARRDDLLRHGSLLSVATVAGIFILFLFNVYMARVLGPEEFGELGALLAIFAIISQLGNAIQLTTARQVARFSAAGDTDQLSALLTGSTRLSC